MKPISYTINPCPTAVSRIIEVLEQFGMGSLGLKQGDFEIPRQTIQLGVEPRRIDILTGIDGVDFDIAWRKREKALINGEPFYFLCKEDFVANKRATGRHKDLADIEALG